MAAVVDASSENKEKLISALKTAKHLNIPILPPDINVLAEGCTPSRQGIRIGLKSCKGLKKTAELKALEGREISDIFSFFSNVNRSKFNIGKAFALLHAGVFDVFLSPYEVSRTAAQEYIAQLYDWFRTHEKKAEMYTKWLYKTKYKEIQLTLKRAGLLKEKLVTVGKRPEIPDPPSILGWRGQEGDLLLEAIQEYEVLGFCVSKFPSEYFSPMYKGSHTIQELLDQLGERPIKASLLGVVTNYEEMRTTKKKTRSQFLLEDESGIALINVFPKTHEELFEKLKNKIKNCEMARVEVSLKREQSGDVLFSLRDIEVLDLKDPQVRNRVRAKTKPIGELREGVLRFSSLHDLMNADLKTITMVSFKNIEAEKKDESRK